jgi:hypothetical protein
MEFNKYIRDGPVASSNVKLDYALIAQIPRIIQCAMNDGMRKAPTICSENERCIRESSGYRATEFRSKGLSGPVACRPTSLGILSQ